MTAKLERRQLRGKMEGGRSYGGGVIGEAVDLQDSRHT